MTSAATPTLRAAIYSRVSTGLQRLKGYGLESQDVDCDKHAAALGATVVTRWDDDESGADWDLPGLNAMLDAAKRGDFDVVIVPEPDRLARNMAKQLTIEGELRKYGVRLEYARFRIEDTPEGRLLKNQLASFAEYEREKIAFRTSRGRRTKASHGLVVGTGPAPYGYRYTHNADGKVNSLEPTPATAPIVQRIFADATSTSTHAIARQLDAEGIPAPMAPRGRAGGWWSTTVRAILANPVYVGRAVYGRRIGKKQVHRPESEWLSANVPALVTPEQAQAAHESITRRKTERFARKPEQDLHLLRALLVCGHCGGQIACRENPGRPHAYICMRKLPYAATRQHTAPCTLPMVRGVLIEEAIWQRVAAILLDPQHLADGLSAARREHATEAERRHGRLDTIEREVERLRAKLARITSERLDTDPGSEAERALRAAAKEAERIITRLLAEHAELAARPTVGLTEGEALALERFASEVRDGVQAATAADRRRIYELLRLRVRVFQDDEGQRLARSHRFRLECQALIDVERVRGEQGFW